MFIGIYVYRNCVCVLEDFSKSISSREREIKKDFILHIRLLTSTATNSFVRHLNIHIRYVFTFSIMHYFFRSYNLFHRYLYMMYYYYIFFHKNFHKKDESFIVIERNLQ